MEPLKTVETPAPSCNSSVSLFDNVESERDMYKEKTEHLKVLIRQMQQELQSYKLRTEGTETVSKLLQESRQENLVLSKRLKIYYSAVENYRNRLEQNGLSTDLSMLEDETFVHGNSKQLLDNLIRENKRLRVLIRQTNGDPEETQRIIEEAKTKDENIADLSNANKQLYARVVELEGLLNSSSDQKDQAIKALRDSLEAARQEFSNRNNLCTSLAVEAAQLKQQLQDVARRCQEMAQQLEERETTVKHMKETVQKSEDDAEMKRVQDENTELRNRLAEVSMMNNRWQTYTKERESILQVKIAELRQKLEHAHASGATVSTSNNAVDEVTREMNKVLDESRDAEEKHRREIEMYKSQLEQANAQIAKLAERNLQLQSHLHQPARRLSQEDSETMEALKQQIQVCTEDFESERKDREKAQARIAKLETDIDQLKKERNDILQRQMYQNHPHHHQAGPAYGYQDHMAFNNYNVPVRYGNENTLAARGPRYMVNMNVADSRRRRDDSNKTSETLEQFEVVEKDEATAADTSADILKSIDDDKFVSLSVIGDDDMLPSVHEISPPCPRSERSRGSGRKSPDMLKCPKCGDEYRTDCHADFLEHIELCCD